MKDHSESGPRGRQGRTLSLLEIAFPDGPSLDGSAASPRPDLVPDAVPSVDSKNLTLAELLTLEREIRDGLERVRVAIALETGSDPVPVAGPPPQARRSSHLRLVDPRRHE